MQPWWPFCARLPSAGRGVTDLLSLSLEARALSEDAGGPADDEVVDTAVFLPVSVASPIRVSRLSVEGETSMSEPLSDSDMVGLFVALLWGLFACPGRSSPTLASASLKFGFQELKLFSGYFFLMLSTVSHQVEHGDGGQVR